MINTPSLRDAYLITLGVHHSHPYSMRNPGLRGFAVLLSGQANIHPHLRVLGVPLGGSSMYVLGSFNQGVSRRSRGGLLCQV